MKSRFALIIVAVALGLLSVYGIVSYVNRIESSVKEETKKVMAVVAIVDIPYGTSVADITNKKMAVIREIPAKYVASGALADLMDQKNKITITSISKGEQITQSKLQEQTKVGIRYQIPKGHRALTINVNEVTGVAGLISVGSYVDVVATFKPGPDDEDITKIILRNVEVLAVNKSLESEEDKVQKEDLTKEANDKAEKDKPTTTVTLSLTPPDVEKMVFSEETGSVWLALTPAAGEVLPTPGQTLKTVLQ